MRALHILSALVVTRLVLAQDCSVPTYMRPKVFNTKKAIFSAFTDNSTIYLTCFYIRLANFGVSSSKHKISESFFLGENNPFLQKVKKGTCTFVCYQKYPSFGC